MTTRFLCNLALVVLGGFLVVATQAWAPAVVIWLVFAVAIAATTVGLAMAAFAGRAPQRGIGGTAAILGAWTIVASMVFAPITVLWLGFAAALGFAALGIAGLIVHEYETERVVHELEVVAPAERGAAVTL